MIKQSAYDQQGQPLSPQQIDAEGFSYCIDIPVKIHRIMTDFAPYHFSGWAASYQQRPMSVVVRVEGGETQTFHTGVTRPDVVAAMAQQGREVIADSGFAFDVVLPDTQDNTIVLEVTVSDGQQYSVVEKFIVERFTSLRFDDGQTALTVADAARKSRAEYKDVWNEVSQDIDSAKVSVAGYTDEQEFQRVAQLTLETLQKTVAINPTDVVLEIGCGVGRMAPVLAPLCAKWIGTDVSENMLAHAATRLADYDNVELIPINGWDLGPIADASVDVVYCTVVFMHLDEWERFNYICEARRVLKPGGRLFIDNYNLLSDEGWAFFMSNMLDYHPLERPANISKSSTPQELCTFLQRAGYIDIQHMEEGMWVLCWASKPA